MKSKLKLLKDENRLLKQALDIGDIRMRLKEKFI